MGLRLRKRVLLLTAVTVCMATICIWPRSSSAETAPTVRQAEPSPALNLGDWIARGQGTLVPTSPTDATPIGLSQAGRAALSVTNPKLAGVEFILGATLTLPPGSDVTISLGESTAENAIRLLVSADGKSVRLGRGTQTLSTTDGANLPITVMVRKDVLEVSLQDVSEARTLTPEQFGPALCVNLARGTAIRNLRVIPLTNPLLLPLHALRTQTNVTVAIDNASPSPSEIQKDVSSIGGVPFCFTPGPMNAVDVAQSMAGLKDPTRNKNFNLSTSRSTNGRTVLTAPGDQYSALHLMAFSQGRTNHVPRVTVRTGTFGNGGGLLEDTVAQVPSLDGPAGKDDVPVTLTIDGVKRNGFVRHVRVPLPMTANVREFDRMDLELTRDMQPHVTPPDPNEFGSIPVGAPSDVVVLAATLERSPVTMTCAASQIDNVFDDTQKVVFESSLTNRSAVKKSVRLFADCAGPGTGSEQDISSRKWTIERTVTLEPGQTQNVALDVTPGKRGWFSMSIGVEADGQILQRRDTSFAVLAPDTRKAGEDSPFGTWVFWNAHTAIRSDAKSYEKTASLMCKAGFRWTYGGKITDEALAQQLSDRYKFKWTLLSMPESYQRSSGWFNEEEFKNKIAEPITKRKPYEEDHYKVMHESRSSNDLLRRFSDTMGGPSYNMPAAEREIVDAQARNVAKYCMAIKAVDPEAKIVMFNDYPGVAGQSFSRGFPREAFDVIGLEGAMFLRQPERQPDWLSVLGNMQETRRLKEKYGYSQPVWTTEALYHPTEDGSLSLHEQAVIYVREAMMMLQLGVQRMAAAGCIQDSADDYRWSNWGSVGFCYRDPEINPKPSYAMYAWMTQVLDQAKPAGQLPVPNFALHAVKFRKTDGSTVCSVWTADGTQNVTLKTTGPVSVYDAFGNPVSVDKDKPLALRASPTPIYVCAQSVDAVVSAASFEIEREPGTTICEFDRAEQLRPVTEPNTVLESNWAMPRIRGDFDVSFEKADGASVMKLSLKPDSDNRKLFARYAEYELDKPIELTGRPYEFTLRLKGNAAWGQVMFQLVDAKGRVWTSGGNIYDGASNAADPRSLSFVRAEGWQTLRIPIVGMYPSVDQSIYWPTNYNWWPTNTPEVIENAAKEPEAMAKYEQQLAAYNEAMKAHALVVAAYEKEIAAGKRAIKPKAPTAPRKPNLRNMGLSPVDYPLKLTRITVSMRPNILVYNDEVPVPNPVILLDRLGTTAPPPGM